MTRAISNSMNTHVDKGRSSPYTEDGSQEVIEAGETAKALQYEVLDMEAAVAGENDYTYLNYSRDVMELMTQLRKDWGLTYPEEE